MTEILKSSECYRLKECIEELNRHHNDVSLNFQGLYPKHPVEDKIEGFQKDIDQGGSIIGVVKDKDSIVGVVKIDMDIAEHKGVLDYLVVLKAYRKYGYGKELMTFALKQFEENRITNIEIHAVYGNRTVDFYKKHGFKVESYVLCKDSRFDMQHAVIQCEDLYLREMNENDFDVLKSILEDPSVMKYYPKPYDDEGVKRWIEWNRENYRDFGFGLWAVCLKENGKMIGDCGITIQKTDRKMIAEIGFHIHPNYQRKGYATAAAKAVLHWGFASTPFNRFYSYCNALNTASLATAKAIGMEVEYEYEEDYQKTVVSVISRD